MDSEDITLWKAMIKTPASMVLIVYTFISVWFVGGLTAFHLYLIVTNQTTYENFRYTYDRRANPFRYRYDRRANPYNKGVVGNFGQIFCTEIPDSKNKFRAYIPREPVIGGRSNNAGFMSPNMGKAVDDIEIGRKAVWGDGGPWIDHHDGQLSDGEGLNNKETGIGEMSPEIRTTVGEGDRANIIHTRRASRGRKSGSWEMSPEVLALASRGGGGGGGGGLGPFRT